MGEKKIEEIAKLKTGTCPFADPTFAIRQECSGHARLAFLLIKMAAKDTTTGNDRGKLTKKRAYQRFNTQYKADFSFVDSSRQGESYAFCKVCRCDFKISHGGRNDIVVHEKSVKHKRNNTAEESVAVKNTPSIYSCFISKADHSVINAEV